MLTLQSALLPLDHLHGQYQVMHPLLLQQKECSNGNCDYGNHEYLIATQFGCSVICFYSLVGLDIVQTLHLVLHDLVDLPIDLAVVTVVAPHRDTPNQQPQPKCRDAQQQVQDVIGRFLLGSQYENLLVHDSSLQVCLLAMRRIVITIVSVSVSSIGVFTIRAQRPIIRECNQIKISESASANESESFAVAKASVRKRSLTGAASFEHICLVLRRAPLTPA